MSTIITVVLAVTAGFTFFAWAATRALNWAAARLPADPAAERQYLAGRVYGVRVTSLLACGDELLVTLAAAAGSGLPDRVYRVTGDAYCRARVQRWRAAGRPLRGYLGADGAIMLADPVLGRNAACEPAPSPEPAGPATASPRQDQEK